MGAGILVEQRFSAAIETRLHWRLSAAEVRTSHMPPHEMVRLPAELKIPLPIRTMPTKPAKKKSGLAFWMQRVLEECDRASVAFAPDPVHDLRVALRRCCSMADGVAAIDPDPAWKEMKKAGKRLFRRLGELRDE